MKYFRIPLVVLIAVVLASIGTSLIASAAQQSTALERGYRTGYSDGYNAGFKDVSEQAVRDFQSKEEYQRADRSYNEVWGPLEDYRDGYQQGFETGYSAAYDRKPFDSNLPTGFKKRGTTVQTNTTANTVQTNTPAGTVQTNPSPGTTPDSSEATNGSVASAPASAGPVSIPRETVLVIELLTPLSTNATQAGDRFQARVVQPNEYATAIVDGHVSQVKRPGKTKGVAQMQLSFDQIRFPDNRSISLHAQLIEIVPMGRNEDSEVDREGGVRGRDSTKDDVAKVGAATGIGAVIGAIAGGGKGAAIGAAIGGGVGTAGVMTQRGKDIRLEQGQQMKIRTTTDTNGL
jgi:hypothetical protein